MRAGPEGAGVRRLVGGATRGAGPERKRGACEEPAREKVRVAEEEEEEERKSTELRWLKVF